MTHTTLRAPPRAERTHRKKLRAGAIPSAPEPVAVVPEEWTTADADTFASMLQAALDATDDARERVRLRRAAMQLRGNPNAHKPKPAPTWPTAPTPEMQARYGGRFQAEVVIAGSGPVQSVNRHRPKPALASFQQHFTQAERDIFTRIYDDAEAATVHNVTINYEGASGGGHPSQKFGGLGNVSEAQRARYVRFNWILAHLPTRIYHDALRWLVLEIRSEGMDTLPNMAEAGKRWVPTMNNDHAARGISIGVLKCLAAMLAHLYAVDRGYGRVSQTESAMRETESVRGGAR